jgi:sulfite reductase (ferredoxin)
LVRLQATIPPEDADAIVAEFRKHYYDTQLFFDPFTGGKFAQYFFDAHENRVRSYTAESAHYLIEQAQLFIEAAHSCYSRMAAAQ